MSSVVFPLTS
uniref:Uncharacterized protein n=1 Tax=Arundo donax TaxID=35708 RepID=A0A0A9E9F7_ARUDO